MRVMPYEKRIKLLKKELERCEKSLFAVQRYMVGEVMTGENVAMMNALVTARLFIQAQRREM